MKIRLYIDEDTQAHSLVRELRLRGVDVNTAGTDGMMARSDPDHLIHATSAGRVLYSFNIGDYCRLHAAYLDRGDTHAGIVLAQQQTYSIGEQLRRLLRLIATKSAEEMRDNLEFLSAW